MPRAVGGYYFGERRARHPPALTRTVPASSTCISSPSLSRRPRNASTAYLRTINEAVTEGQRLG